MIRPALLSVVLLMPILVRAEVFEYIDPMDPAASLTIDTTRPAVAVGDVARSASFCDHSSKFICVDSDAFKFAVPKRIEPAKTKWEYGGRTYSISSRVDIVLLGVVERRVLQIHSVDGKTKLAYLYSPARGLLAVQAISSDGARLLIAKNRTGYGAARQAR